MITYLWCDRDSRRLLLWSCFFLVPVFKLNGDEMQPPVKKNLLYSKLLYHVRDKRKRCPQGVLRGTQE